MRNITKIIITIAIATSFGFGMIPGYFLGSDARDEPVVYITSFGDGQVVHSRVVVDASFPDGTFKKEVLINDTLIAGYTPFVWNNMWEKAGHYKITVRGHYKDKGTDKIATADKNVVIPAKESFSQANFTVTEDVVIHAGQNVSWSGGLFNISTTPVYNGGGIYEPHYLDIMGNLTMTNLTIIGLRGGLVGGVSVEGPRISVRSGGVLIAKDVWFGGIYMVLFPGSTFIPISNCSGYSISNV